MGSETHIALSITSFFILLGIIIPIAQTGFGMDSVSSYDTDNPVSQITEEKLGLSTAWEILKSVFLMFFWTFGQLPAILDGVFVILRLALALSIAKMIRG
jgi:hypothetical protein